MNMMLKFYDTFEGIIYMERLRRSGVRIKDAGGNIYFAYNLSEEDVDAIMKEVPSWDFLN